MSTFDTAVLTLFNNEGGFSDDKYDAGGATNFGITGTDYSKWLGRTATRAEIKAMPRATAIKILRSLYWFSEYEQLPQAIATAICDWGLLSGTGNARRMAQKVANELGAKISVDGAIGPASIAALNKLTPAYFISRYQTDIMAYLNDIVKANSTQSVFLDGWSARIKRYSSLV